MKKIPLIIIAGATAVGKSDVALALAKEIDGEIISADSLQVYRYFDIGSAKPSPDTLAEVTHHLINVVDPGEPFTAGHFNELAYEAAVDIHSRGKRVIICGGTGLYIKALIQNFACGTPADLEVRERLRDEFPEGDTSAIYERLKEVDPKSAEGIHPGDRYRIERALEVYYSSGERLSDIHSKQDHESRFDYRYFILNRDRELLYKRIGERVMAMIEAGLREETQKILDMGYAETLKPFQTIGYAEMLSHIKGEIDLEEAIELIARNTRRFAKRQLIWFRGVDEGEWVELSENSKAEQVTLDIKGLLGASLL
ncbi:MAG: tRNA (adenosine(37)-N6)-dimethylallyltransferase MiaA [Nitrospinae bacterium]|nr:tRNA (adenosine(37)-N6)-dimethylallyltransferase MiaA [Nitrospinota bacterium]